MSALKLTMVTMEIAWAGKMQPGDAVVWGNAAHAQLLIRLRDMGGQPVYRAIPITPGDGEVSGMHHIPRTTVSQEPEPTW